MLVLHGLRLWDSGETIDLRVGDSKTPSWFGDDGAASDGDIDAEGYLLAPGLADPHVHFRDPGQTAKESMVTGARAAASGGFTQVLIMPNTQPELDGRTPQPGEPGADEVLAAGCVDAIDYLQRYSAVHGSRLPVHYDLSVCASDARAGKRACDSARWLRYTRTGGESHAHEPADYHPVTAISDDGSAVADGILDEVLANARRSGLHLLDHCEHHEHGVMNDGPVSRRLGFPGIPSDTELAVVRRDIAAARRTGTPVHLQHVSTARAFDAVRTAKREGLPISCETAPHYLALCDEDVTRYGSLAKMNPPLRSAQDRQAALDAVADGTVDMIATDHAPHTMDEKHAGFLQAPNGVIGLETSYAVCHSVLVDGGYIDERRLIELMAINPTKFLGHTPTDITALLETQPTGPRRLLNLAGRSSTRLRREQPSVNLTVLAPRERWTVRPERFHSKARNTPFADWKVTGLPVATILDAQLVFTRIPSRRRQGA